MAGLDVARQAGLALDLQAGVVLESRQQVPGGRRKALAAPINPDRPARIFSWLAQVCDPGRQFVLVLPHDQAVGQLPRGSIGANRRVETVEGDGEVGSGAS